MAIPKYLTQGQLKKGFKEIKDPRDRALFAIIYHYGLRMSEALWVQVSDSEDLLITIFNHPEKRGRVYQQHGLLMIKKFKLGIQEKGNKPL